MEIERNTTNYVEKISIPDTLMAIPVGETVIIPTSVIKTVSIRAAASRLEKKRMARFFVTERGLVNETQVTRLR